jgi:hypothetical protein
VIRYTAPPDDTDRCDEGGRPDAPHDRGHGGPPEAPGIKSRGCKKDQQHDPIASRDQSIPMWNIRRGCQSFFEQFGIMTKQPPIAEYQMTRKHQRYQPRGRPIDASSETEEHTSEERQIHDAPHQALD